MIKMYNLVGIRQYKKDNEDDCMIRCYHRNNMGRIFKIENADSTYKNYGLTTVLGTSGEKY